MIYNMDDERDISRMMTLRNLEQLRLSSVLGAPLRNSSTLRRTVLDEDREQRLALIEKADNLSDYSSSLNDSQSQSRSFAAIKENQYSECERSSFEYGQALGARGIKAM